MTKTAYDVCRVDLADPSMAAGVSSVITAATGHTVSAANVLQSTSVRSFPQQSLFVAAIENDEVIGFNAFASHHLLYGGETLLAFQSCFSATSPQHRGKGVFVNIQQHAKEILRGVGGEFIFGWPNENSRRIFSGPLAFREVGRHHVANVARWVSGWQVKGSPGELLTGSSVCQNDQELIERKRALRGEENVLVYSNYENVIWGIRRTKQRVGLSIPYFSCGGIIVNNAGLWPKTLAAFATEHGGVFVQFVFHSSSPYLRLFPRASLMPDAEPLIVFDLARQTASLDFNFMAGVRDVF